MDTDFDGMAREVLSKFQTDYSDYGHSDLSEASSGLVSLIRLVVQDEILKARNT